MRSLACADFAVQRIDPARHHSYQHFARTCDRTVHFRQAKCPCRKVIDNHRPHRVSSTHRDLVPIRFSRIPRHFTFPAHFAAVESWRPRLPHRTLSTYNLSHGAYRVARYTGILGLITFLGLAYAFSTNRRAIRWRTVAWGLGLQLVFAFLVTTTRTLHLSTFLIILLIAYDLWIAYTFFTNRDAVQWRAVAWPMGALVVLSGVVFSLSNLNVEIKPQSILHTISLAVTSLLGHSADGSTMVFGRMGTPGDALSTFAFAVLPTIIFVSAFFAILYHIGVMQQIIKVVAWVMQRTMGTSGAESTNVAASIFMGQTEAPLTIRPFLGGATRSELMTIMTSGMAHVSGGIMAAYISFGINAQDLLSAVIMTAPGTILVAKMLVPETEVPATMGTVTMQADEEHKNENFIGAIARGTIDGGQLAFNVAIMLVSFLALVGLVNACMLGTSNWLWAHGQHHFPHSLGNALGTLASPIAWLIGIP